MKTTKIFKWILIYITIMTTILVCGIAATIIMYTGLWWGIAFGGTMLPICLVLLAVFANIE